METKNLLYSKKLKPCSRASAAALSAAARSACSRSGQFSSLVLLALCCAVERVVLSESTLEHQRRIVAARDGNEKLKQWQFTVENRLDYDQRNHETTHLCRCLLGRQQGLRGPIVIALLGTHEQWPGLEGRRGRPLQQNKTEGSMVNSGEST